MSDEVLAVADASVAEALPFDLGQWVGRHQALAWVASRCSAADAHALRQIREQKLYRALGLDWEEFCPTTPASATRKQTALLIAWMSSATPTSTSPKSSAFPRRIIVPCSRPSRTIRSNSMAYESPSTAKTPNSLIEAVRTLSGRLEEEQARTAPSPLVELQRLLDRAVGEISGAMRRSGEMERELLILMVETHAQQAIEAVRQALADA